MDALIIIHAVAGIVPSDSITLLEKTSLPMEGGRLENGIPTVDEDLARACAAAIRPKQGQEARAEWLVDVLCVGTNSFWQQGEPAFSEQSPTHNRAVSAVLSAFGVSVASVRVMPTRGCIRRRKSSPAAPRHAGRG